MQRICCCCERAYAENLQLCYTCVKSKLNFKLFSNMTSGQSLKNWEQTLPAAHVWKWLTWNFPLIHKARSTKKMSSMFYGEICLDISLSCKVHRTTSKLVTPVCRGSLTAEFIWHEADKINSMWNVAFALNRGRTQGYMCLPGALADT